MKCGICGEEADLRFCDTCGKGTLPDCDKEEHYTYPCCLDCWEQAVRESEG